MRTLSTAFVDVYAESTGRESVWGNLSDELKKKYIHYAAVLVHAYTEGLLDDVTDSEFENAIAEQVLHVAEHYEMYAALEKIGTITNQSYSDGVLSVSGIKKMPICFAAKSMIDSLLSKYNVFCRQVFRG